MITMNPKEIKTHNTFTDLFPIKPELQEKIENDMKEGKFDLSQHIMLGTWPGLFGSVCIDGHTRLQAAINAGIEEVPVWIHEFESEDEAISKAIKLQQNRRNMSDSDIIVCVALLDSKRARGGDRRSTAAESKASNDAIEKSPSKSAKETADLLGISTTKVERTRAVLDHGDSETLEAVKQGEMSINKACTETRKKRKADEAAEKSESPSPEPSAIAKDPPAATLAADAEEPVVIEDAESEPGSDRTVTLNWHQYRALRDLGKSIEHHVELAIDMYLRMVADGLEQAE